MKRTCKRLVLLAFSLVVVFSVMAQVTTSSISGRVTDGKEPLIGATVKATHTPTGTVYGTVVQSNGTYHLSNMRIGGPYTVEVSMVGFEKQTFNGINLTLGEDFALNANMQESNLSLNEVEVVAQKNYTINSNRTGAQEIITRSQMDKLPTLNHSLNDFTKLTPMNSGGNFGGISYRFNNVTVDGASFNNSFGLSSALGASGIEPISLEALEQVQVMIAPYDVRNGGFTGAGVNSVTKSGSNEWHASAYMYVKSPSLVGYRIKDQKLPINEFSNHQYGVSLSGPIIKNKLFFFINGELDRVQNPITYTTANSIPTTANLSELSNFLQTNLGYNPGSFDVTKTQTMANRLTARLDWNINQNNVLSLKYFYLKSYNSNNPSTSGAPKNGRGPNEFAIPYSSTYYRTNNNFNIVMLDLNTKVNDKMSNYFKIGYSAIRDFRDVDGGFFPQVDILNGSFDATGKLVGGDQAYTTFGTEANSYNNMLNTNIFQLQDNFIMNFGNHQITVGTQSDYRGFKNGFSQNYPGSWVFNSIQDFEFNVLATKDYLAAHNNDITGFNISNYNPVTYGFPTGVTGKPNSSVTGYSTYLQSYAIGDNFPFAYVNVYTIGLYAQDKWTITDRFNLTYGLRVDMPIFTTNLATNDAVAAETYRDGIKVDVSKYPSPHPIVSPRLGFNWKPLADGSLQVRGGTGIFSGTPPYVWLSNQAGNNGKLFGSISIPSASSPLTLNNLGFTGDVNTYKPKAGSPTRADIAVTDPKFKYPNLWKSNIAADYKFDGWIATIEVLYSKNLNDIYHDNIGIIRSDNFVKDGSGQNARPFYGYYDATTKKSFMYYSDMANNMAATNNKPAANNVVMLRNTNKGHSLYTTLQLQRTFYDGVFKGLYVNGSFTFGEAKSVTDGSSSVATSAWKYRPALDPNAQELGWSSGSFNHRLLLSASYTINWSKNYATNFGLIYQAYSPFRYSYTYNGDANGDGQTANDPIYIPKSLDEVKNNLVAGDFGSVDDAWTALDNFIKQDPYLSKHRGQYSQRNGGSAPFVNQVDLSIYHDLKFYFGGERSHTLRFSFDIVNFLNLLNKNWGVQQTTVLGNQQYQFLTVTQKPSATNDYTLQYKMNKYIGSTPSTGLLTNTFKNYIGNDSRWQIQFGIKYIF